MRNVSTLLNASVSSRESSKIGCMMYAGGPESTVIFSSLWIILGLLLKLDVSVLNDVAERQYWHHRRRWFLCSDLFRVLNGCNIQQPMNLSFCFHDMLRWWHNQNSFEDGDRCWYFFWGRCFLFLRLFHWRDRCVIRYDDWVKGWIRWDQLVITRYDFPYVTIYENRSQKQIDG